MKVEAMGKQPSTFLIGSHPALAKSLNAVCSQ